MKLAVLLYGHLRDYTECVYSLRSNLLERYDCDLFIHTWDETNHHSATWHENALPSARVSVDVLQRLYEPAGLIVEHQKPYAAEEIIELPSERQLSTAIPHYIFYSMNAANELRIAYAKEHGIIYDLVLVARPDVAFIRPLDIERVLEQSKRIGVDVDHCRFHCTVPMDSTDGLALCLNANDVLFFGVPKVIDQYIAANLIINEDYIRTHAINPEAIYTAKELEVGLRPTPIAYLEGRDWSIYSTRVNRREREKKKSQAIRYLLDMSLFRGKRVALFGAGKCGQDYYWQLRALDIPIVCWVASRSKTVFGQTVEDVGVIGGMDFDVALIAISDTSRAKEMRVQLLDLGVPDGKIYWNAPFEVG